MRAEPRQGISFLVSSVHTSSVPKCQDVQGQPRNSSMYAYVVFLRTWSSFLLRTGVPSLHFRFYL